MTMLSLTRVMASLAVLPVFLPILVSAIPAPADPLITPAADLSKRQDSANVIGYSLSGASWKTRSCNNGFFSTSGGIGNCCANGDCEFVTGCSAGTLFYDSGSSTECGGTTCGTGAIFATVGDQSPLLRMFNCQSDWTVTIATTTIQVGGGNQSPSVVTTTEEGSTVTVPNTKTTSSAADTPSPTSQTLAGSVSSSTRAVTTTVTNPDGSISTSTSMSRVAVASASGSGAVTADTSTETTSQTDNSSSSNAGVIAGAVVGGVAAVALAAVAIVFILKRNKNKKNAAAAATAATNEYTPPPVVGGSQPQQMEQNGQWGQSGGYDGYRGTAAAAPIANGYSQDYKYAAPAAPAYQQPQPAPAYNGAQELYSGPVQAPVEMPTGQHYGR